VYKPLLAAGLRGLALLVTLCYLDHKALWQRNGSYTRALWASLRNLLPIFKFDDMKTKTMTLFLIFITSSILGQIPKNAISIEDKNFNDYFQNDKNIPVVKGKILNLSENEIKNNKITYSIVTPFNEFQIEKNCEPNIDGSFELELDYAFPYQQIWLSVGNIFYAGIYSNKELFIELDAEKIKPQVKLSFNGDGVKYLGIDGELNLYLNNHVLFKRNEQLDIDRSLSQLKADRNIDYKEFITKYDSLYVLLNKLDGEYLKLNPSSFSWIIINERKSDYYADLCVKHWGKEMSLELFERIKNHKTYLTSNNGMLLYKYLFDYITINAIKNQKSDYKTYKSYSKLEQSDKALLDSIILIEENISQNRVYDTTKYLSLIKSANDFLHDTLITDRTLKITNLIDSIFTKSKSDLLKLHLSIKDPNDQKLMLEAALNNIKTNWCKSIILEQYDKSLLKLTSIEKVLNDSKPFISNNQLGEPIAEMSFGAKLYKVDTMDYKTLLANLKSSYQNKALIIDFWATWCSPCLSEMPYSKKLHDEAKDLPVEFIYLCTSRNSDIEKWKSKIAEFEIGGVHIFVDQDIESKLMNLFSAGGFPSYVFIDKKGDYKAGAISRMSNIDKSKLIELIE
jgi:thiol-disulfide isomerase/thioredoxin